MAKIGIAALGVAALAWAAAAQQLPTEELPIGFLEIADDPRFDEDRIYARIALRPLGRAFAGAEVALGEAAGIARFMPQPTDFTAVRYEAGDVDDAVATIERWVADEGIHFVMLDMPGDPIRQISARVSGLDGLLLFNVAAADDDLRGENCQANMLHTVPSFAMQMDALMQYLIFKKWRELLVLVGPLNDDAKMAAALQTSAKKYGAEIVDTKPFILSNDPRIREQNNVALMTAGEDYDVIAIVDADGEFGRYVPYQTNLPRPVVGSAGLVPAIWHWSWERHGAPQLNSRFEQAQPRRMTGQDWSAWMAVKVLVQAVLRTKTTDFQTLVDYIRGDDIRIDGFKGPALSFRAWDNQLRQPILLATDNAVIVRAPIRGFLHSTNDLDTLGADAPDTTCRF